MSQAYICPECNGYGYKLKYPNDVDRHIRRIKSPFKIQCYFCEGKGWRKLGPVDKKMCEILYGYRFQKIG